MKKENKQVYLYRFEGYNIALLHSSIIALTIDQRMIHSSGSKMSQYFVIRTRCPQKFIEDFLVECFTTNSIFHRGFVPRFSVPKNPNITIKKIKNLT